MTVKEGIKGFLEWKSSYLKSCKSYAVALKPVVDYYGQKDLKTFSVEDTTHLVSLMNEKYSRSTISYFLSVLKMFARYAHYSHIQTINPELIKQRRSLLPVSRPYVTDEDLKKLCLEEDDRTFIGVRNITILNMLYDTGARISELLSLTLEDLTDGQTNHAIIETKKNGNPRFIVWSKETHRKLQTYLALRISRSYRTNMLFINKKGAKLTPRGVQHLISYLRKKAGIKKPITPHSFRHGKAHKMINQGANIKEIGVVLGHSENNPKSALQYLRLDAKETLKIAHKFVM